MSRLRHTLRLDPRPEQLARLNPRSASVNIPCDELTGRVHELPPRGDTTIVLGDDAYAAAALEWFSQAGRECAAAPPLRDAPTSGRFRLWKPNAFLEEVVDSLHPGRALDVACGSGRDAVFLADLGWRVTAVDVLPDALALGQALERRYAPDAAPVVWQSLDLENAQPPHEFEGAFDLICVFRYLHRPLFSSLKRWLAPGGSLVCETFTTLHRERHGKPSSDAHVLRPGEFPQLLEGLALHAFHESWHNGAHTARAWAVQN